MSVETNKQLSIEAISKLKRYKNEKRAECEEFQLKPYMKPIIDYNKFGIIDSSCFLLESNENESEQKEIAFRKILISLFENYRIHYTYLDEDSYITRIEQVKNHPRLQHVKDDISEYDIDIIKSDIVDPIHDAPSKPYGLGIIE